MFEPVVANTLEPVLFNNPAFKANDAVPNNEPVKLFIVAGPFIFKLPLMLTEPVN